MQGALAAAGACLDLAAVTALQGLHSRGAAAQLVSSSLNTQREAHTFGCATAVASIPYQHVQSTLLELVDSSMLEIRCKPHSYTIHICTWVFLRQSACTFIRCMA